MPKRKYWSRTPKDNDLLLVGSSVLQAQSRLEKLPWNISRIEVEFEWGCNNDK